MLNRLYQTPTSARLFVVCLVCTSVVAVENRCLAAKPTQKPNIVVFLVDDMGWTDCGAYGSKYYQTPNIDRFAKRGMRFTSAYAQPLCSATRASLMSGKYSARHRVTAASGHQQPQPTGFDPLPESAGPNQAYLLPRSQAYLDAGEYTLAEALRDAGYRTGHFGKWHLGLTRPHWPEQQGFDVAFHCHPDPGPPGGYFSPYGVTSDPSAPRGMKQGTITDGPAGEYIVDRLASEAVAFIAANKDRPFFLNLWNYGVHGPWGHKEAYTAEFAKQSDPSGRQGNPIMASMLRSVDECFGRVLAALDEHGLTENTIVVFNSDNGGNMHSNTAEDAAAKSKGKRRARGGGSDDWRRWAGNRPPTNNAPLRDGKGTLYEGGTRVPLVWCWPNKIAAGAIEDAVVAHIDLYPTLLAMLDVPLADKQQVDGASYAGLLTGRGDFEREALFNYFPHGPSPERAGGVWVRTGDWKLIRWFGVPAGEAGRLELYNLANDPGETRNLAAEQTERAAELAALIDRFLTDTGAAYPRPNPSYRAQAKR